MFKRLIKHNGGGRVVVKFFNSQTFPINVDILRQFIKITIKTLFGTHKVFWLIDVDFEAEEFHIPPTVIPKLITIL